MRGSDPGAGHAKGTGLTGYAHPDYIRSLREFGTPLELPASGGWLLEREIPGTSHRDAMGPYPRFTCRDWSRLSDDLDGLQAKGGLVSVVLVTDPFAGIDEGALRTAFDRVTPFKRHHVVDYHRPDAGRASKHHRYYARRALSRMEVEVCADPSCHGEEWIRLYRNLTKRHDLRGLKAFSRMAFTEGLAVPGAVLFRAHRDGDTLGAHWWFTQADTAYSHLAASSDEGYAEGASYALYQAAIRYFEGKVDRLDLGSGSGLTEDESDGLGRFKRGWANAHTTAFLCGRVLDGEGYARLSRSRPRTAELLPLDYFPAYRAGELG
jgi:hypothetical protein